MEPLGDWQRNGRVRLHKPTARRNTKRCALSFRKGEVRGVWGKNFPKVLNLFFVFSGLKLGD